MNRLLSHYHVNNIIENNLYFKKILKCNLKKKACPFPLVFQIQTINGCNGSCIMCPNGYKNKIKNEPMSDTLFKKIIDEISREKSSLTYILLYLQNEPLLDNDIFRKIKLIKQMNNGLIRTKLITNGTLLTPDKIKELEESKLDDLIISVDAYTEETFNKIRRGLNFSKVLESIDNILESNYDNCFYLGFVKQKDNIAELNDFIKYWRKKGVPPTLFNIDSRSGDLPTFESLRIKEELSYFLKLRYSILRNIIKCCANILTTFNILHNGDIILCINDYNKKMILGNVNESSIKEIWNSDKYNKIREMFFNGEYKKIPVCNRCTNLLGN